MKKILLICSYAGIISFVLILILILSSLVRLPQRDFDKRSMQSLRIVDRNGIVLREFLNDEHGRGEWMPLSAIAKNVQDATLAVEDRRFYYHPGIDPIAIARSIIENIAALRFKSGGSTLTQQVIRNVYPHPRTLGSKIVEMWRAIRLERMLSKQEILEQYLNRAPYGNQLYGIEAASRWYFDKPAKDLSLAESAFLAALPNAPSVLNPNRNIHAAAARERDILQRMYSQRRISMEEFDRAVKQPIQIVPNQTHFKAPHVIELVEEMDVSRRGTGTIKTTIDYSLQEPLQWLVRGHLKKLEQKNVHNAAVIIIENKTGEIRALIGSADFFDSTHNGQVNGVIARRQPGSAIKPFMYTLTIEHGFTPATILADIPTAIPDHHGDYVPENYDKHYHGPVRLRTALACSYNVPAVRALQSIGKSALLEKLKDLGFTSLENDAEFYGYGLTLGNAEVSLLELTTAYMALANRGIWKPAILLTGDSLSNSSHRVYDESAAYLITSILKDDIARRPAFGANFRFPFQCAVKTGTTKDYKDNWTIGYTTRYTVGVWVGNFDGKEMHHVSGVSGAGPIFTDIMTLLHSPPYGQPAENFIIPDNIIKQTVCGRSGKIPTSLCKKTISELFIKGKVPKEKCDIHREYLTGGQDEAGGKEIYEIFPEEYKQWAFNEGLPVPPKNAQRVTNMLTADERVKRLMIVSPNTGDYFKIDPVLRPEYQIITIAGFVPKNISQTVLRVNGTQDMPFGEQGVQWKLEKGIYRFQLFGNLDGRQVTSMPVFITVE